MIRKMREARENEEGFTLIELLVVVIIIGILAAIAIPSFLSQRERAWQAGIVSDTRNAALEVEALLTAANGDLPGVADGQAAVDTMGTTNAEGSLVYSEGDTNADTIADAFCVTGDDTRLDNGPFVYQSNLNGMQDPGVACTF